MSHLEALLTGGDLRSIAKSNQVAGSITSQKAFDELLGLLFHSDRLLVMRAADALEKVTALHPEYLSRHKQALFSLTGKAEAKELKWHLAQVLPRLQLSEPEVEFTWRIMQEWAADPAESKIVRVNALQALFELLAVDPSRKKSFEHLLKSLSRENISSLNARIRKLQNSFGRKM